MPEVPRIIADGVALVHQKRQVFGPPAYGCVRKRHAKYSIRWAEGDDSPGDECRGQVRSSVLSQVESSSWQP